MPAYTFGAFEVNPQTFHVSRDGTPLSLEPKAIRVLIYLIENRQRTVSKEELLRAIWENTFVGDNALTRVIAQLRKALNDDARQARYIETVPTMGYRFLAEVSEALPVVIPAPIAAPPPRRVWLYAIPLVIVILGGATAMVWNSRGVHPTASANHTLQITSTEGYDISPVFSPDGSSVAYASNRSGSFEVYVRSLALGGREIAITSDGQQNMHPAWSPDGRLLAYESLKKRGIFTIPALGGVPTRVTTSGARPSWSSDSKAIVYQTQDTVSLLFSDVAAAISLIAVVPAQGGESRMITSVGHPAGRHLWPRFSPDGKRVMFLVRDRPAVVQLWTMNIDGTNPVLVHYPPGNLSAIDYGGDSQSVILATVSGGDFRIQRVTLDPRTHDAVGPPVELTRASSPVTYLALTADGRRLVYSQAQQNSNLWSLPMDPATARPTGPARAVTHDTNLRNSIPQVSPDGTHLAWWVNRRGSAPKIWVADGDGSNARPFSTGTDGEDDPQWLDSQTLIYLAYHPGGNHAWVASASLADGLAHKLMDLEPTSDRIFVSPDGREMAYQKTVNGVLNIWKRHMDGSGVVQLTFDQESAGFPTWSKDGKWLALELDRGNDVHAAVVPANGGPIRVLTEEPGQDFVYTWSPDSSKLSFAGNRQGAWNLFWVDVATRKVTRLTDYDSPAAFVRYPTWSAKGDQIIFEKAAMQGNIFVLDLDGR